MGQQPFTGPQADRQTHRSLCCLCLCDRVLFGSVTDVILLPLGETETNATPPARNKAKKTKKKTAHWLTE